MEERLIQLSRTMSYALRHNPQQFGLTLDDEGWVQVEDLLQALRNQGNRWRVLREADFAAVITQSDKQRYEMRDGRIRAFYGHSVPLESSRTPTIPPTFLYHGTTPQAAQTIRREGLRPMGRQYVHLSADEETALQVALRRTRQPVILKIATEKALQQGCNFYLGNEMVWLADAVPATCIE